MKKWHLWVAASIGLVVIAIMMAREFSMESLQKLQFTPRFFWGVGMAVVFFALQNWMLTLRFHHLVRRKISLWQCFRINVLCEFTSAVTPSAVGGSGLAFIYLSREGVAIGRSIFTMFAALLADEPFLGISSLLLYLLVPSHFLFSLGGESWVKGSVQLAFLGSTLIVMAWTLILYVLLLLRPDSFGWVLKGCCKIPFLRRFLPKAEKFSHELTMASREAKLEGKKFWIQLMGYTSMAWLFRFAIVVAILIAFHARGNMLLAWSRQWVMWMISILSPTPGGSGVAELMFRLYYTDFLPDASLAILAAMLWRLIFYYPFLVMGTLVLPKWMESNRK